MKNSEPVVREVGRAPEKLWLISHVGILSNKLCPEVFPTAMSPLEKTEKNFTEAIPLPFQIYFIFVEKEENYVVYM